jgi:hypothetical protein
MHALAAASNPARSVLIYRGLLPAPTAQTAQYRRQNSEINKTGTTAIWSKIYSFSAHPT